MHEFLKRLHTFKFFVKQNGNPLSNLAGSRDDVLGIEASSGAANYYSVREYFVPGVACSGNLKFNYAAATRCCVCAFLNR